MIKTVLTAVALTCICSTQTACAVLLTGYLVGDAMARNKAVETCRANLKTTNDARIAEHKDPFPDQCSK